MVQTTTKSNRNKKIIVAMVIVVLVIAASVLTFKLIDDSNTRKIVDQARTVKMEKIRALRDKLDADMRSKAADRKALIEKDRELLREAMRS